MKYKLVLISDTHNQHIELANKFDLPPADFIIHAGDISGQGDEYHVRKFLEWFSSLYQYDNKIFIAGNHDWLFEREPSFAKSLIPNNVHYLEDSGVEIWGLKFWGSPVTPPFYNWAFNRPEEKLKKHWSIIPEDIDVLITHGPPLNMLDFVVRNQDNYENVGSPSLHDEVTNRIKPKLHVFGHVHEGYGEFQYNDNDIKFINASSLNKRYQVVNKPKIIEIEK